MKLRFVPKVVGTFDETLEDPTRAAHCTGVMTVEDMCQEGVTKPLYKR